MTQRLHKVILDGQRNHFALVTGNDGKPLQHPSAAAAAVNPRWPPYEEACLEAWELYPHEGPDGSHQHWVLRAHLRCCCSGACHYASDHAAAHDAYAKVPAVAPGPGVQRSTPHGRDAAGASYVEARLESSDLAALAAQAAAVAGNAEARKAFGARLQADANALALGVADIEDVLGDSDLDANGLLNGNAAVMSMLAGDSIAANNYYCVAAFLKLWQRLIVAAHNRLSRDWPQRGVARPISLAARQKGSSQ